MPLMRRPLELALLLLLAGCQAPMPAPPTPPPPPPAPACPEPLPPPPQAAELKAVLAYAEELRKALAQSPVPAAQIEAVAGAADPQAEPLKPLATLIAARLAEQRRLQDSVDKLTQQLRDSQRRSEQLSEKLEALKAIEQTLPAKPGATR